MPELATEFHTSSMKMPSATEYTKKFDDKLIEDTIPNGTESMDSLSALIKALKQIEAEMENETTDNDKYGAPLAPSAAHLKKCIESEKFVTIFTKLPIKEQNAWMTEKYKNIYKDLPQTLIEILPGVFHPGDCRSTNEIPDWLDMEKFRKGQEFIKENYSMSWLGALCGLHYLYMFEDGLRPIIMSGKTQTTYGSFKRYLSTFKRMDELYFGDPWTEGSPASQEVKNIRMQHLAIRKKLCKYDNKTIYNASTLSNPYSPTYKITRKDFQSNVPIPANGQCPFNFWSNSAPKKPKSMNQIDMALVQLGFVAFVILKPEVLGIYNATDENIESFCHLWRGIGYLLGIKDEFNFCRGSVKEIKQRAKDVIEYWLKPALRDCHQDFEHMMRAFYTGISYFFPFISYEVMSLQIVELLDVPMPNLYASLNYPTRLYYHFFNFITRSLLHLTPVRKLMNMLLNYCKERALAFDTKKHQELKEKSLKSPLNGSIYQPLVSAQ